MPADAERFPTNETAPDGVVFIVCQLIETGPNTPDQIHLQGITHDRRTAVAMCRDESYFIGPVPLNVLLPHRSMEWIGLEFPLRRQPK
jgi:hypothetical protein